MDKNILTIAFELYDDYVEYVSKIKDNLKDEEIKYYPNLSRSDFGNMKAAGYFHICVLSSNLNTASGDSLSDKIKNVIEKNFFSGNPSFVERCVSLINDAPAKSHFLQNCKS
jgi:hypothetical protein